LWAVAVLALFRAIGSSTFLFINAVHSVLEGKLKFSDRSSTGSKTTSRKRYGWRSKIPSFSFLNGSGTWISDRAGDATVGVKRLFHK
jgi:chitin synthase